MVYRLQADLFFDNLADTIALQEAIKPYYLKSRNVPEETSTVMTHECGHDEIPPRPCTKILYTWEKV